MITLIRPIISICKIKLLRGKYVKYSTKSAFSVFFLFTSIILETTVHQLFESYAQHAYKFLVMNLCCGSTCY